jgi:hypothetical protein
MNSKELYKIKVRNGRNLIEIEGDKSFVDGVFQEVKTLFPRQKGRSKPAKRGPKPKPKPSINLKNLEIKDILPKLDGKNADMKVLVSAYCINKKLRKREFRSKEMNNFMDEYKIDKPNNLTYYFRKLMEDKLLNQGRKQGRFKISDDGIKHIEFKLE